MKTSVQLLLVVFVFTLYFSALRAQCPDRKVLWSRIVALRDSIQSPPSKQLAELLPYLEAIKQCDKQDDSTYALLLQRIGWLYMLQKNDYEKCIQLHKKALTIINKQGFKLYGDLLLPVRIYNNLRICYDSLRQVKDKMEAGDSCIATALRLKTGYKYIVPPLYARVVNFFQKSEYRRCIEDAELGESIIMDHPDAEIDSSYYSYAFVVWRINALYRSKKFDVAERIILKKINQSKGSQTRESLGSLYSLYADIKEAKGEINSSISLYNKSIHYNLKSKNYSACAATLNNIGYIIYFKRLKNYRKALNYYYQALRYATSQDSSNTLGNIANVFVEKGLFDSAFYYFQKAFDQIRPGISEAELLNTFGDQLNGNYTEYISGLLLDKADAHLQQYKISKLASALQKALHLFRLADSFFTRIKFAQSEQESKLSWRAKNRRLYEHAIEAAYFSGLPEQAFYFFEKSRAVLLHDQLNEQRLFNQDELLSMAQIKRNQSLLQQEADTILQTSDRYKEIQQNLFFYSQRIDGLMAMIKRKNPSLYESLLDSSVLTMRDIRRKILVGYTALVELFSGDSSIYSLVITNKEICLNRIDKDSFQRLSASFFSYDSSFSLQNSNFSNYIKMSNSLYHLIFDGTSIPKGRVIISPDGTKFPFEALVMNSSTAHPVYFLEDYSVSYTYSAGYLLNSFKGTSFATGELLGLAPVQYHYMPQLNSLEGSDQSLDRIASYFGKHSQLIGNKATRRSFMEHYSGYSIIQLYTHASDKSIKDEPVIWFSDSALFLSDLISESKPITRLIVLSACETGSGKFYEGEGVFSFNRGFAALGIPAAITNLWSVDSKSTYELTELFYKYLADGFPTDVALQKAKLDFIQNGDKEKGLPYYWAAPIIVGKAEVIQLNHSFRWTWIFIVGIGLSAIGMSYFIMSKRKLRSPYQ